jgi:hypothetical protein
MKLEFKYKKKAEHEDINIIFCVLLIVIMWTYGIIIGILLNSNWLMFFLTIGVLFIICFLVEPLAKISIRKL